LVTRGCYEPRVLKEKKEENKRKWSVELLHVCLLRFILLVIVSRYNILAMRMAALSCHTKVALSEAPVLHDIAKTYQVPS